MVYDVIIIKLYYYILYHIGTMVIAIVCCHCQLCCVQCCCRGRPCHTIAIAIDIIVP